MEEDPEDMSSLHFQIMFPPHEASNRQREYELEQHLALMDEPAQAPVSKRLHVRDNNMEDMGNLTIEHLNDYDGRDTTEDNLVLMEDDCYPREDLLDIGIQASDLGSLLQQFEQTEAAMTMSDSISPRESAKTKCKSSKGPAVPDPMNLAKKIAPAKRKTTILLEPLAMPSKRLRAKDLLTSERSCVSLPGSRASSPVAVQNPGMSLICSADQGFDYLVMDHDYCSVNISNGQVAGPKISTSPSPINVSAKPTAEERKAVYKQKYKVRKKGKKPVGRPDNDKPNLINKLPDYIHPMPPVVLPPKISTIGEKSKEEIKEAETMEPPETEDIPEKPVFFDKIPDYFLGKHMYQEISKVAEEEAKKKEEMTRLKDKEETLKLKDDLETRKEEHHQRHRSHHHGRGKLRRHRKSTCSNDDKAVLIGDETLTTETPSVSTISERKGDEVKEIEIKQDATHSPQNTEKNVEVQSPSNLSNGYSHLVYDRKARHTERRSRPRSRSRSISSQSSHSRSSSRSSVRKRSYSSSSSQSSHCSRSRRRRDSRDSYTSESSSSSQSRSRSRSYSCRKRSRRYSTYSSASRTSSSSRSRSRSRSRIRHWRPRSYSRSRSRSDERSRVRSRSRSGHSGRSRSRDSNRRHRSRSRRRSSNRRSRSRSRRQSLERQEEERRKWQLKEQEEQWADRRVIYIGRIPYGTTRHKIKKRFEKFGEIERVTLHFRDVGDNYAFVTFLYKCDAYAAVEGANKEADEPEYDICFGGRRQFCKSNYEDLDSMNQEERALEFGYDQPPDNLPENKNETDFDRLLREAMKKTKR